MFDNDDGAGETAISYTNQFMDGAVAKIDSLFGAGYAKQNPALLSAYLTACAGNLTSFMSSALAMTQMPGLLDELGLEEEEEKPRRRSR